MAEIVIAGLEKRFGEVAALRGVDLEVGDGELVVLVGPSGCGKSTVLRLIAGLEEPSGGSIRLGDRDLTAVPPQARDVAMVFQGYALYPHLTVAENMAFPLKMRRVPASERTARVREIAELVGLQGKLGRLPGELSGGERQRVAMGRAIVRSPRAFLFDEPLSNLDAKLRAELRVELCKLVRRLGTTAVYVTHDQSEAMTMGDRVVVMDAGRIQQVGAPREVYQRPANVFVAGFIGSPRMNLVELGGAQVVVVSGPPGAHTVGFRPEHVRLGWSGGALAIRGTVAAVEPHGAEDFVYLEAGATLDERATRGELCARAEGFSAPVVGAEVEASVAAEHLHWFDGAGARLPDARGVEDSGERAVEGA